MKLLQVDPDSPALTHGVGLFETMLVRRRRAVDLPAHLERLNASCRALDFPLVDALHFERTVRETAEESQAEEVALRCLWVPLRTDGGWSLVVTTSAIPPLTVERRAGARVIVLGREVARSLPQHKLTSYAVCELSLQEARRRGANEALFTGRGGRILEGTSSNVFAIDGDTLLTAPLRSGILPGVVRAWVISNAPRAGLRVVQRAPSSDDLLRGSFLTGSLTMLAAVRAVDGRESDAPGEAFNRLRELYLEHIDGLSLHSASQAR